VISVAIPLYNKQNSISSTLQCVLQQSFKDFEIIVIDDGSTDNSILKVKEFEDKRIRLIQKKNGGVSSARNRAIEEAKYNYIAFLDADDYWEPSYLEEQAKLIHDFPMAYMWGCAWGVLNNSNKQKVNHSLPEGFRGLITDFWEIKRTTNIFCASAVVIKKDAFSVTGNFDERICYAEDLDMWYRIILNFPVVFYNNTLAYYTMDSENRAMNKNRPLSAILPYYIEKYKDDRAGNISFRRFIDRFSLAVLYPYYLKNKKDKDVKRILDQIDFSCQPFSKRLQFRFPHLFKFWLNLKK